MKKRDRTMSVIETILEPKRSIRELQHVPSTRGSIERRREMDDDPVPLDPASDAAIRKNIAAHDRIAAQYEARHGEIFNETEQRRLQLALRKAVGYISSGSAPMRALDFGCGSGNLSRHLLDLDLHVVAADVSEEFLTMVTAQFPVPQLSTLRLNGSDLGEVPTNTFDLVAAYSVFHHIPDYLAAVVELARVCKRGGVLYIDHERTESSWIQNPVYQQFWASVRRLDWRRFLFLDNYVERIRRWFDPRYSKEGDIHVWPDDHIEWSRIEDALVSMNCEILSAEEYLLNRRSYRPEVYEQYRDRIADMRLLIARKR